jgi:hypothetical protein
MRFVVGSFLSVVLLLLPCGLGTSAQDKKDEETSKSFSFATYKARDDRTVVLVSTLTAALFENEPFIPIQVAVGVRGKGPKLRVTAESFELIDRDGQHYPMPSYQEVANQGNLLERVEIVRNQNPIVIGQQFANCTPVPANFFPAPGTNILIPRIEMPRETYFITLLYFPFPDGGLEGVLTLRFQAEGLPEPIDARIKVPLKR